MKFENFVTYFSKKLKQTPVSAVALHYILCSFYMAGPEQSNRADTIRSYEKGTAVTTAATLFTADTSFPCYVIKCVRRGPVTYQKEQTKEEATADIHSGHSL